MAITAKQVNELRKSTGAGMMDCKKALVEAEGDFEKAVEILRKKGQKISAKRADREANEGSVFVHTNEAGNEGIIVALNCETDFVAKNDSFLALGKMILDAAVSNKPGTIDDLKGLDSGDGMTVGEKIIELVGKLGEKLEVSSYEVVKAEAVVGYTHAGSKLGVLVALTGSDGVDVAQAGRDVAMQIAAMNPVSVSKDDVDPVLVAKELEIGREIAIKEGKPEAIIDKIAQGKLQRFFKDNTLLSQNFVKDSKSSVQAYLTSVNKGLTVSAFKRVSISA